MGSFRDDLFDALTHAEAGVTKLMALLARYDHEYPSSPGTVPSGTRLQPLLDAGGTIRLEPGGVYPGTAIFRKPYTSLLGAPGATIVSEGGPGLYVKPGTHSVTVSGLSVRADGYAGAAVQLGDNGPSQVTLGDEPHGLDLRDVQVPTHRGRRAFEVNSRETTLTDCGCRDTWLDAYDSAAIWVINSSGKVIVAGGSYQAGSHMFISGGDVVKIFDNGVRLVPSDLAVTGARFTRPQEWRTDGIKRNVKNLFEIKNGCRVRVNGSYFADHWPDAQPGEAFVFTPTRGGICVDVQITDCIVERVPAFLTLMGRHYDDYTPQASSLSMERLRVNIDRGMTYGTKVGSGWFAKVSAEPEYLLVRDMLVQTVGAPGDTFFNFEYGSVRKEDGSKVVGGPLGKLSMEDVQAVMGRYGFRLLGQQGGGSTGTGLAGISELYVQNNEFGGDNINSYQKKNFPQNTYLTRAAFDASYPW